MARNENAHREVGAEWSTGNLETKQTLELHFVCVFVCLYACGAYAYGGRYLYTHSEAQERCWVSYSINLWLYSLETESFTDPEIRLITSPSNCAISGPNNTRITSMCEQPYSVSL